MVLNWKVRYLDGRDRTFKDRNLWLTTESLSSEMRAAVEASFELQEIGDHREMLRHRHLFSEQSRSPEEAEKSINASGAFALVFMHDYFEDENGAVLAPNAFAEALTGKKGGTVFPAGAKPHDVAFFFAKKAAVNFGHICLKDEDLKAIACFARDLRELAGTAFFKEKPAKLTIVGNGHLVTVGSSAVLSTAASDEEIRSFIGIFRRLYMVKEPGSFQKAADLCSAALSGYPIGSWIAAAAAECVVTLKKQPEFFPFSLTVSHSFTLKRLIDVFIYTQYAHQPNATRLRQFSECLQSVGNDRSRLTFHFLTGMWSISHQFVHIGRHIISFFDAYSAHHQKAVDIVDSAAAAHPGIGTLEKRGDAVKRVLWEKAAQLARSEWEEAGCPEGGHQQFIEGALERLKLHVGKTD